MSTPAYCCDISQSVGEPLLGSAPFTRWWLMLEYRGTWGSDVLPESDLSPTVKDHLGAWLAALPTSKLIFIRQPNRTTGPVKLFVHDATTGDIFAHELATHDDLLALDVPALTQTTPSPAPLYLTCVNGKRDVACSKFGMPVYAALQAEVGDAAWQCSHIGGHRFAATGVWLPYGIVYGRLDAAAIPTVIAAHQAGQVALDFYRGRSIFPPDAQVAEGTLLAATERPAAATWHLADRQVEGTSSTVTLRWGDQTCTYTLVETLSDYEIAKETDGPLSRVGVYKLQQ